MPTIPIQIASHIASPQAQLEDGPYSKVSPVALNNPLPKLIQTPTGLALLEIQGTLNLPSAAPSQSSIPIGRLVFPDYDPGDPTGSTACMKTVHLYVGRHQRLTGEVKKLPKAIALLKKAKNGDVEMHEGDSKKSHEQLEMVEVVEWKIIFSSRPEPVGN